MSGLPSPVADVVIDVSHNNGPVNWSAVAEAGIVWAFIKATQGTHEVDPLFATNRAQALAAGMLVCPYHFLDGNDAAGQAAHFLAVANPAAGDPVMLDWEQDGVDAATLTALGKEIGGVTKRAPIGYYGASWVADPEAASWPLMLPAYPLGNKPGNYASLVMRQPRVPAGRPTGRPYDFHQYTPAGRLPGVIGPVDRSVWVGTITDLIAFHRGTASAAPAPTIPQAIPGYTIMLYAQGDAVRLLQQRLVAKGYLVTVDADFGPETQAAVRKFQTAHGVIVDGVVGPQTWGALMV